jgi:hypothetical protein
MLSNPALDFITNEFPPGSLQFTTFEAVNYKCFKEIFPKKKYWKQLVPIVCGRIVRGSIVFGRVAFRKNCSWEELLLRRIVGEELSEDEFIGKN